MDRWAALTAREAQIVSAVVRGGRNKAIAFDLGVTTSTVATHLSSARQKLGARTRVELITRARLGPVTNIPFDALAGLSIGERDVAQRALAGLSDRAIACERRTSPRTIANQLRRVYRRFGVSSRAELAAFVTARSD